MILLQRWEPTVTDLFPTNISFNVRIHGIPLQYWSEGTILTIGSELRKCIVRDIKEAKIWVEINGLQPLIMRMEIECPTEDVTEVEFEYIKIEKHCFTCFSLFHEENDCPHRPHNALPPKDRVLGITQSIALQRIEAEKRRHDERRGYRRPDEMHAAPRSHAPNSSHFERERAPDMRPHSRLEEHRRDRSILSRTARSQSDYHRRGAPSMQYRVVEKSRFSSDSSAPQHIAMNRPTRVDSTGHIPHVSPRVEHQRGSQRDFTPSRNMSDRLGAPLEITNAQVSNSRVEVTPTRNMSDRLGAPMENANAQISNPRMEITPARNLQSRIEIPSANRENTHSGSREKRPVHERLSDPGVRKPSFDSGRLQRNETLVVEDAQSEHEDMVIQNQKTDRIPATLRLKDNNVGSGRRSSHSIPLAPQSKALGKRKVTPRKRVMRSPLQTILQKKTTSGRSTTSTRTSGRSTNSTRRKLAIDKDPKLPCDKAGTSNQRRKNGPPTTVFIPGSTRGGVDFRPQQNPLP